MIIFHWCGHPVQIFLFILDILFTLLVTNFCWGHLATRYWLILFMLLVINFCQGRHPATTYWLILCTLLNLTLPVDYYATNLKLQLDLQFLQSIFHLYSLPVLHLLQSIYYLYSLSSSYAFYTTQPQHLYVDRCMRRQFDLTYPQITYVACFKQHPVVWYHGNGAIINLNYVEHSWSMALHRNFCNNIDSLIHCKECCQIAKCDSVIEFLCNHGCNKI